MICLNVFIDVMSSEYVRDGIKSFRILLGDEELLTVLDVCVPKYETLMGSCSHIK